jgi:hypothetical protein
MTPNGEETKRAVAPELRMRINAAIPNDLRRVRNAPSLEPVWRLFPEPVGVDAR